jgi:energy-coupling factor transport system ATP-binding protein
MERRIEKYSKLVDMDLFLNKNPENLSGGQKQRVAIAGVLAMESDLIIFDESTSMLDPKGTKEINKTIKTLKEREKDKTIISITHELEEALYADRILVLNNGKIVLDGKPTEVLPCQDILEASGLKVIDGLKLIKDLEKVEFASKKEVIDTLWESIFQM